jgi:hypothetical protein
MKDSTHPSNYFLWGESLDRQVAASRPFDVDLPYY